MFLGADVGKPRSGTPRCPRSDRDAAAARRGPGVGFVGVEIALVEGGGAAVEVAAGVVGELGKEVLAESGVKE